MIEIASGTATAQNLAAGYVPVVTVPAPASGAARYLVELRLTGLAAAHQVETSETYGAAVFVNPPQVGGDVALLIEVVASLKAGGASLALAVRDAAGLSAAAAWSYTVYEIEQTPVGGGGAGGNVSVQLNEIAGYTCGSGSGIGGQT